jgi:SAM-dependent methyltransferase
MTSVTVVETVRTIGRTACVACGSDRLETSETIDAVTLAEAWRREDEALGAVDLMERRTSDVLAALPAQIRFVRCGQCGLQMAEPPVVWSASAYPRDQSYPVRWEFARCLDDLGRAPLDVLELGCGTGHFLAAAVERGHRAVGIDFTDTAVAQAQARGLRAFCGGMDDLTAHIGHAKFDAVVFFHVLEHLADPAALLQQLCQWTRPGARLFLSCPNPRRFTRLIREQQAGSSDYWDYPPQHVARWTLPALQALLPRHGWRIDTAIEEPFSWTAAASQIGVARATYKGQSAEPIGRRANIALGWFDLLLAPECRGGVSLYVAATKDKDKDKDEDEDEDEDKDAGAAGNGEGL